MDNTKPALIGVFKNCLNILRDNEGLTGEKALRNLSYLLILKLLEPRFGGEIAIDDYKYDFSHIKDEMVERHRTKLLEIVRFSILAKENEDNIPTNMKYLWEDILAKHPATKNIFLRDKWFDIRHKTTYKKLIDKLNSLDLTRTEYDVLGNAYEEVIQDIMTGKVLGQFFTQPLVKKMMVKLINPQIYPDGKIDTCGDPTMGTGGFLITYLQCILQQAASKNITPDWEFIKTEGLYGKELEPDTYQLAVSNMLISSGHMFERLDRGDSIRSPITRKFDNILANPPFGIKGLKYDDFHHPLKREYVPIKTSNAVSLFIQAIIYMLKINGKCAVVLPDGQDLFSKTNTTLVAIRKYLIKTCDLKEIIYLPSGIFTYTSIKTCVFYFIKKKEGTDVLETKINISTTTTTKTQKEKGRDYKFSTPHQTTEVKFYDYNPYDDIKTLLVEVPIEKIVSNTYSLNYAEYVKDDDDDSKNQYEDGVVIKTLGEVCSINPENMKSRQYTEINYIDIASVKGEQILKLQKLTNDFPTSAKRIVKKGDILYSSVRPNLKGYVYISDDIQNGIASTGFAVIRVKELNTILSKYLYYIMTRDEYISNELISKAKGALYPVVSFNDFYKLKIPIPPLEKQQEIVKYLDFIYEKANKTSNEKIVEAKQLNEFCINNQKVFGENVIKTLGEVCKVNQGTYIKSDMKIPGNYPVYGGGNVSYYINQYNREDEIIVARCGVSANCVRYEKNKFFLIDSGWTIRCTDEIIIKKYMFYYLQSIQSELLSIAKGVAQLGINQQNFYKLKIPIPPLEKQQEIVEYCEYNDAFIKQLETRIEDNKKQAYQFITSIVKVQVKN